MSGATTNSSGQLVIDDLDPGTYTLTETATGTSAPFTVAADQTTTILVINYQKTAFPKTGAGPGGPGSRIALLTLLALVGFGAVAEGARRRAVWRRADS